MDYKELLGEELGTQVEGVLKDKNVNLIVDDKEKPSFIPKSRFDEVIGSKNELKAQVSELTNQLESLKKSAKGNEELTQAIEELQGKNVEWEEKYKKNLIDNAVKIKAMQHKVVDPDILSKILDYDNLQLDEGGNVKGLDDQILNLKESKSFLFEQDKQVNNSMAANPANVIVKKSIEEQYDEARKSGNMPLAIHLKNKMFGLE